MTALALLCVPLAFALGGLLGSNRPHFWRARADHWFARAMTAEGARERVVAMRTTNAVDGNLWIAAPTDAWAVEILLDDSRAPSPEGE